MTYPRSTAWAVLSLCLATTSVAAQTAGGDRSWHDQAAQAAEAAATKALKQEPAVAPIVPQPVPATRMDSRVAETKASDAKITKPDAAPSGASTEKGQAPAGAAAAKAAPVAAVPAEAAKDGASTVKDKGAAKTNASTAKKPAVAAKQLFGAVKTSAPLKSRSIGWYAKGCLAGAKALPIDGPAWQAMRLSRNRNWGHPELIAIVERLAKEAKKNNEWPGLLVGDISQPRGGPMLTGHASHQVGLDADIWFTPMPNRTLTRKERENLSATSMLADDDLSVDPKVWGEGQVKLVKRAASYDKVERVLVHPAIKKALCEASKNDPDKAWLEKVRPYWGHYYHFHVRIGCPEGSGLCKSQPAVPGDDGCGAEVTDWLKKIAKAKEPPPPVPPGTKPAKPAKKKPEITLADLPSQCRTVLASGGNKISDTPARVVDTSKDAAPPRKSAAQTTRPEAAKNASAAAPATAVTK